MQKLAQLHAALKRHRASPPQSPSRVPPPDMIPQHRTHSAPTQGSLPPGWLPGPALQEGMLEQGSSQQPLSGRSFLPGGGPLSSQQQAWSEGYGGGAWGGSGGYNLAGSLLGGPEAPAVEVAQSQPLLSSALGAGSGAGAQGRFHGSACPFLDWSSLRVLLSVLPMCKQQHILLYSTLSTCACWLDTHLHDL